MDDHGRVDMSERICSVDDCARRHDSHGYCSVHAKRWRRKGNVDLEPTMTTAERFWSKVRPDESGCWVWTAGLWNTGYGQFNLSHAEHATAHRWSYEAMVGEIPHGLTLDHLCRNRACVNPDHLDPVPHAVNILRGTSPHADNARKVSCHRGHPFDEVNTKRVPNGRQCRTCIRENQRRRREAKRAT